MKKLIKRNYIVTLRNLLFVFSLFLFCFSCSGKNKVISAEIDHILSVNSDYPSMINALLAMDQKYPRNVTIKCHLGITYLLNDDIDSAIVFLTGANDRIRKNTGTDIKYLIFAGLTDAYKHKGNFPESKDYAKKALQEDKKDSMGVVCALARAEKETGDEKQSLVTYAIAFKEKSSLFQESDYSAYIELLVNNKKWQDALRVYYAMIAYRGYQSGDGLNVSSLHEKNLEFAHSISAAMFEMYGQFLDSNITLNEIRGNIEELKKIMKPQIDEKNVVLMNEQLEAFYLFFENKYADAYKVFKKFTYADGSSFEKFFFFASLFMSDMNKIPLGEIANYVEMEPLFTTCQSYYYYLWNGMKRGEGSYTYQGIKGVLDKTLSTGRNQKFAADTKREITRLLNSAGN